MYGRGYMETSVPQKMAEDDGCPTASKKRKTFDVCKLCKDFWSEPVCKEWQTIAEILLSSDIEKPFVACPLKVESADANMCRSYRHAYCSAEPHCYTIGIGSLFKTGITILLAYLKERRVPKDVEQRKALLRFIQFQTSSDPSTLFGASTDKPEHRNKADKRWCLKMAQHLLAPLSPSKKYIVDKRLGATTRCPCSAQDQLYGKFGDTSFGCKTLWHGNADLMFRMPLQFITDNDDDDNDSDEDVSKDEYSSSIMGIEASRNKYERRAQTIGFGFYAHRKEREKTQSNAKFFLVPHLAFSREKFCLSFYDSVNDILLETDTFFIEKKDRAGTKLSPFLVLLTWLALDYQVLGGETPACLMEYKSGFHQMFEKEILDKYMQEIECPCHAKHKTEAHDQFRFGSYEKYNYEDAKQQLEWLEFEDD